MEKEKENVTISSKTIEDIDESTDLENMKKIEAALFLSARFLTLQELVLLTDVNPLMLKELMEELIEKYQKNDSAIEIIHRDNMWKMDVGQEHVSMINKLATGSSEFTKAEQETLAVIAYKQPVKQSVIIKIRGNKAYDHIKTFTSSGLVIAKKIGHTKELKLSDDFFDYFHLQNSEAVLNGPGEPNGETDLQDNKNVLDNLEESPDSTDLQNSKAVLN
jgi:segregation and condensation protein B